VSCVGILQILAGGGGGGGTDDGVGISATTLGGKVGTASWLICRGDSDGISGDDDDTIADETGSKGPYLSVPELATPACQYSSVAGRYFSRLSA